jgi:hypothetical protein
MSQVALRPVEVGDLDAIFEQMRDPESVRMAAFTAEDPNDRSAFAHMAEIMSSSGNWLRAIICDSRLVGTIGSWVSEGADRGHLLDRSRLLGARDCDPGAQAAPRGDLGSADPSPCCERQRWVVTSPSEGGLPPDRYRSVLCPRTGRRDRGDHSRAALNT